MAWNWWTSDESVPMRDAILRLLDHMDDTVRAPTERPAPVEYRSPIPSGVRALDRVLNGGLPRQSVTMIEADLVAQAHALLCTVARRSEGPCLFDTADPLSTTAWIVAGTSGIPEVFLSGCYLSDANWEQTTNAMQHLAASGLQISSARSFEGLDAITFRSTAAVILVEDAGRFGSPVEWISKLVDLAHHHWVAVITATEPLGDLPSWALESVVRISMASFNLGGKASLLRIDGSETVASARVEVECLSGNVI